MRICADMADIEGIAAVARVTARQLGAARDELIRRAIQLMPIGSVMTTGQSGVGLAAAGILSPGCCLAIALPAIVVGAAVGLAFYHRIVILK
jgi:hypothetical protein